MFIGLGLLSLACVINLACTSVLLCPCCCSCSCCAIKCCGQACASIACSVWLAFSSFALSVFQIAAISATATFCSSCMSEVGFEENCDYCFSNAPRNPNLITSRICPLKLVQAGVGTAAGLSGCAALLAAGNFAQLSRTETPAAVAENPRAAAE